MNKLLNDYWRTQIVQREFEATLKKEEEELNVKKKPLEEIEKRLEEEADTLPVDEERNLREMYNEEARALKDYAERRNRALRREQAEKERELLRELQDQVQKYGTSQGYSMILHKSTILYGGQSYDLTEEILENINKNQ
jgi:Skp family chaperone for outer membrane proteins